MSSPTPPPQDLLAAAQRYQADIVAFLRDLVRIPSVNGRHNEAAVAERITEEAKRLGFPARLVAAEAGRPNALVHWGEGPQAFALIGHMDTVAEGETLAWEHPPFEAQIDDGRLYGRGAADNKAGIACALYTLVLMREGAMLDPATHRVVLAGVVDEESGASSSLGVRYLLDEGLLQAEGAIYTYASDIICIGHRGLLRLILRATGQSVHTGSPAWSRGEAGVNAVTGLAAVLVKLEDLDLAAPSHPAFDHLGCTVTPGTLVSGGEFESMVPTHAEATVDVRLMPGQAAPEILKAVERVIDAEVARRPGLSISIEVKNDLPAASISPEHPLVETARHHTKAVTGEPWPVAGAGPANEGYMLIEAGIPTLCGFGPRGDNAHAPNEWVALENLPGTTAMYAGIIRDYLAP